ncbi:unnamed protein product, partial [Didymodactylos carnosus]
CCRNSNDIIHDFQRDRLPSHYEPSQMLMGNRHHHMEHSLVDMNDMRNGLKSNKIVLEVNGARGKRYSTISTTSMTYLTSGVWDDSSTVRSRINSIAATSYCGEHSSSRPSTSTEDSLDHSHLSLSYRPTSPPPPPPPPPPTAQMHLTIPTFSGLSTSSARGITTTTLENIQKCNINITITEFADITEADEANEDNDSTSCTTSEATIPRSITQSIAQQAAPPFPLSTVRKASNLALKRTSDASVFSNQLTTNTLESRISQQPRKVSFVNPVSKSSSDVPQQQYPIMITSPSKNSLCVTTSNPMNNLLTADDSRKTSVSSRRPSTFDCETQRMLERQQTQERLSNIRTTLTLFIV